MKIFDLLKKYCMDALGAGVMNPDYKSKTGVEKRLHGSPNFDVNHFKKQHDAKLKSIKNSYEEYLREAEDQEDKDRAKRWYEKKLKDENQFWENIRKGRYNPMDIKTHYMVFTEQRPSRAGAKGNGWFKKDSVDVEDAAGKKRYELHYSATDKGGRSYLFVKEAVCTPGELKSVMKKIEDEQKSKGVEVKLMFKRASNADSAEFENDVNGQFSVGTVICHKTAEGDVVGEIDFTKNGKHWAAQFRAYSNGNWEEKPNAGSVRLAAAEKASLLDAARKKLATLGIKAK